MDVVEWYIKRLDVLVERAFGWNELAEMLVRLVVFGPLVAMTFCSCGERFACWLVVAELLHSEG